MIKCFVKLAVFCFFSVLLACSSTNNKPLLIDFSSDSAAIVFNNIDRSGLLQLQNLQADDSTFNHLISVLQTPSEQDSILKEQRIEGKVMATDSNLVFIPGEPFVKGRDYLVITHLNARFGSITQMMKGELKHVVKARQKLLTR